MAQALDLDTLHHILKQYSDDVLNDSSWIICKLLNSVNESSVLQDLRTFTSIKVLLNLYERLCKNNCETKIKFPVNLLIKHIKTVLQFSDECCDLENNIQFQILCILKSLYKIPCVGNCLEAVGELAKLYNYCMTCLSAAIAEKGCKQDSLLFNLKMVQTVYDLLRDSTCNINTLQFCETSKSKNECQVFTKLVLHGDNDVAIQTLLFLVPGYIDVFKTDQVLVTLWEEVSNSIHNSSVNYSRAMLILCNFLDAYFDKNVAKKEFLSHLLEDANYWQLMQSVLVQNEPTLRKQGMHVFKKTVEALHTTTEAITCSRGNIIFYWDSNSKDELYKLYSEIIIILEFLDEQQIHIIKPIFKVAETLLSKIQKCDKVSPYWVFVVCHKALIHDNTEVLKWGLTNLLLSSAAHFQQKNQHCQEDIAAETVALLVPKLNTPALYYGDGLAVSKMLVSFFDKIAPLSIAKAFFRLLIKQVCSLAWSPESLFFVVHAISTFSSSRGKTSWWGRDEISHIRAFVLKAFKTYNKIIAAGIQCELLRAVTKLTDVTNVPLKSALLLVSSFSFVEAPTRECKCWRVVVDWLGSYSHLEAEQALDSYKNQELGREFNERSVSIMFILLYKLFKDESKNPVGNHLSDMLLLFKDIERRPYCRKSLYDQYLSVIEHIFKANASHPSEGMLKFTLPLIGDVMAYIRSQLKQISGLQDFGSCQLYLNAFENICKVRKLFGVELEEIDSIYAEVLGDLETSLHPDSESSSVGLYCRIRFLNLLLELHPRELKQNFLASYLLTEANVPLEKRKSHREQTKDMQVLWGRINSEFIEAKWKIMEYLINNELIIHGAGNPISDDELTKLCAEGLHSGGYEVLRPVMAVLKKVLPATTDCSQAGRMVASIWKLMMERRKTDEFKSFGKGFVEMLFQKAFILRGEWAQEILTEYADKIFSTPSLAMVNILLRHVQLIDLADSSQSLFCHIIGKALIFGPVQRRDEKLTTKVCSHIESFQICPVWKTRSKKGDGEHPEGIESQADGSRIGRPEGVQQSEEYFFTERPCDHFTSNEVRARAVERILTLQKDSQRDQAIAKKLMDSLMKMEGEVGGNRERYFCDSYVHRAKHRAMQALLLLEPLLSGEEDRKELLDWLYKGLLMENPQPSVRYLKEWLLIRMLVKARDWEDTLHHRLANFEEFKARGLCSLMVVQFHLCQLLPQTSHDYICALVPLLMHQHVEVRLHAQVFICYHYDKASSCDSSHSISNWQALYRALCTVSKVMREQGVKSFLKLEQDFFLHSFNPLQHYSLETIYSELPVLAGVGSDEWISTELLRYCGVDPSKISVPLENTFGSLKHDALQYEAFRLTDSSPEGKVLKEMIENYQKKIIPSKHSTPDGHERGASPHFSEKEGGLVVVASLIDRVPNLGGLARTCEIFGVSEYVIGSLRYAEDKQFTSLSVTAEKWIALKEVKESNLLEYLLEMKQNGYTVVGAEQTLHSQQLNHVKFPKKTLLLLGNEKEGIPPNLLPLLDVCVEIPQMGIIRSLNVHVTGALFIWEYAKQNNFDNFARDE